MNQFEAELSEARAGRKETLFRMLESRRGLIESRARDRIDPRLRAKLRTSDLVQSAYFQAFNGIEGFRGKGEDAFITWFLTIVDNQVKMKRRHFLAAKRQAPEPEVLFHLMRHPRTPSAEVSQIEELSLLREALASLPDDYRRIILLKRAEGLSHEEIAAIMGRSPTATRALLSRAQAALALALNSHGFSDDEAD